MHTKTDDQLLDVKSAAAFLNIKPGTLDIWRCTKRYNLPFIKVGRHVRYSKHDLQAWLESRTEGAA